MKLSAFRIQNFRSIVDTDEIRIESLQAFVGENNAGKSNILKAIDVFLSPGSGGVQDSSLFDKAKPIIITATFSKLTDQEKKALRTYLISDMLILEKHISLQSDRETGKVKLIAEYHGYRAEPKDWWLSMDKIATTVSKPDWKKIAEEHGLLPYMQVEGPEGKINKKTFEEGLHKFLQANEAIEYESPTLGPTQALGIQPNLLRNLPRFYLLPAITDYSSEIDRRSSTTIFRRLMGDLADRILTADPRYTEVDAALKKIRSLLNFPEVDETRPDDLKRLASLDDIETKLTTKIRKLMPSVVGVRLEVVLEETREFFSRGVALKVDDGVMTDVLQKGHGLQRSVVFGLLQTLITNQKASSDSIILAIEEPELYIHPQMQRLIYAVLGEFSKTDQVIYSTHSPAFVDIGSYNCIGVVRKESVASGTHILQCGENVFGSTDEEKAFMLLNSFGLAQNQVFFARKIILVEGEQDVIAIIATARKSCLFVEYPEEIGYTIVVTDSKGTMPKFQKVLNAFNLPYIVLHEMDGKKEKEAENQNIIQELGSNRRVVIPKKLEDLAGAGAKHFKDTFEAKLYFGNADNITPDLEKVVTDLFS